MNNLSVSSQLEDSAYMFDAVWAAALALNNTDVDLTNFTHNGPGTSQSIYNETLKLNFFGLTVS